MKNIKRFGNISLIVALLISAIPINVQATELINDLNGQQSSSSTDDTGGNTHGNAGNNDGTGQHVSNGGM